jgi:hypothetical protein
MCTAELDRVGRAAFPGRGGPECTIRAKQVAARVAGHLGDGTSGGATRVACPDREAPISGWLSSSGVSFLWNSRTPRSIGRGRRVRQPTQICRTLPVLAAHLEIERRVVLPAGERAAAPAGRGPWSA